MKHIPQIKTVMTPFPYAVDIDADIAEAQAMMSMHNIHHLPVTDSTRIVGIVTNRDIALVTSAGQSGQKVRNACTLDPYIVDLQEPLDNVLLNMAQRHLSSTLVTRKGRLAGLFTNNDACRCFCDFLRERFLPAGGDDAA
jgi:signal-transduction protein with cAMP-binding, CBS, and nucleotidyltransferase domain